MTQKTEHNPSEPTWWRKRADAIEAQVAATGSSEAMRCYTDMRTLLQAAAEPVPPLAPVKPPHAITASLMRDDGGDAPAFCVMVAYRSKADADDALSLLSRSQAAPAGSCGWEGHAKQLERELDYWRTRAKTMAEHQAGEVWYWQGDGDDHPESWVNTLPVVIRADQLRELMAKNTPTASGAPAVPVRQLCARIDQATGSIVGYFSDEQPTAPAAAPQAPAAPSADERAAYVEFLTGKFPRSYGKEEAGRWWDQGHVSALTWQAARAVAAAPAAPAVDAEPLFAPGTVIGDVVRDTELIVQNDARYRLLRRGQHWSVIDGKGDVLRGDELDSTIDARLAAQAAAKGSQP